MPQTIVTLGTLLIPSFKSVTLQLVMDAMGLTQIPTLSLAVLSVAVRKSPSTSPSASCTKLLASWMLSL